MFFLFGLVFCFWGREWRINNRDKFIVLIHIYKFYKSVILRYTFYTQCVVILWKYSKLLGTIMINHIWFIIIYQYIDAVQTRKTKNNSSWNAIKKKKNYENIICCACMCLVWMILSQFQVRDRYSTGIVLIVMPKYG